MEWEVILKWLPKLMQGATLTLELVAIAVIAGLYQTQPINRATQIGGQPLAKPPAINRPPVTGH